MDWNKRLPMRHRMTVAGWLSTTMAFEFFDDGSSGNGRQVSVRVFNDGRHCGEVAFSGDWELMEFAEAVCEFAGLKVEHEDTPNAAFTSVTFRDSPSTGSTRGLQAEVEKYRNIIKNQQRQLDVLSRLKWERDEAERIARVAAEGSFSDAMKARRAYRDRAIEQAYLDGVLAGGAHDAD